MVSVVLISTVLSAGILNGLISRPEDPNQETYFRAISEYIISNPGIPSHWGSDDSLVPEALGLARVNSLRPNELDVDKVSRLNGENAFALDYSEILAAAKLTDVAVGISVSQLMDIAVSMASNETRADLTSYTFRVFVSQDGAPVAASMHCYVVAKDFLSDLDGSALTDGLSYVEAEIPNVSNGTALLVVFARALHDLRITACEVYAFGHLSSESLPNNTFLNLSPLNYTLFLRPNVSGVVLKDCYAFSYGYESNLTSNSNTMYAIPTFLDKSPTVLVISGSNDSTFFIESTVYPEIPLEAGASFQDSECHAFSYLVTVQETLYRLTLRFGGINN